MEIRLRFVPSRGKKETFVELSFRVSNSEARLRFSGLHSFAADVAVCFKQKSCILSLRIVADVSVKEIVVFLVLIDFVFLRFISFLGTVFLLEGQKEH